MVDTTSPAYKERAFTALITPIREWVQKFTRADTTPDNKISAKELSEWIANEWRSDPKNNDASLTKMRLSAAQALALREEVDNAPRIPPSIENVNRRYEWIKQQNVDPRTMLISLIVAPEVGQDRRTGLGRNLSEVELRADLQRFASETNQSLPADGGVAIAREVAQGMAALNGVQTIVAQSTSKARDVLANNQFQLPFAKTDYANAIAEDKRITRSVAQDQVDGLTPEQLLAAMKAQAAKDGQTIPPAAEAALARAIGQMMGPAGRAQSAKALSDGIDKIKADMLKSGNASGFGAELNQMINGPGGAAEQTRANLSAEAQKRLAELKKLIAPEHEEGGAPRGKITQKQYDEAVKFYEGAVDATVASQQNAGRAMARELSPQVMQAQISSMLDGAKKTILETAQAQAAQERARKTGLTVAQLKEVELEREKLAKFKPEEVAQPTLRDFKGAVDALAQGRESR